MEITFTEVGWNDLNYWLVEDKKKLKKINKLIKSIIRDGILEGEGKPERLKHINAYSRRIDQENRLVYRVVDNRVIVIACRGHYTNK